jgi:hypothetical protein
METMFTSHGVFIGALKSQFYNGNFAAPGDVIPRTALNLAPRNGLNWYKFYLESLFQHLGLLKLALADNFFFRVTNLVSRSCIDSKPEF